MLHDVWYAHVTSFLSKTSCRLCLTVWMCWCLLTDERFAANDWINMIKWVKATCAHCCVADSQGRKKEGWGNKNKAWHHNSSWCQPQSQSLQLGEGGHAKWSWDLASSSYPGHEDIPVPNLCNNAPFICRPHSTLLPLQVWGVMQLHQYSSFRDRAISAILQQWHHSWNDALTDYRHIT